MDPQLQACIVRIVFNPAIEAERVPDFALMTSLLSPALLTPLEPLLHTRLCAHASQNSFWGDFAAGVSVASVLIPQSMSYATSLAHLDASTGLFSSAIPGIIYALFGTCRQLNVGPEAALSLLIGQTISALVSLDPHSPQGKLEAEAVSTIVVFQVGSD